MLQWSIVYSPIKAYEALYPVSQPVTERENSSSDIRIESEEEIENDENEDIEKQKHTLGSTLSYSRRQRVETHEDSGDDAGLPLE